MSARIPEALEPYLQVICVDSRFPAHLAFDKRGRLTSWGGACDRYSLDGLANGMHAEEVCDLLPGLFPLSREHECLPMCRVGDTTYADVHLVQGADLDWVVFLDATAVAEQRERLQQALHDSILLREREGQLLQEVNDSHSHLLTIMDQLELATIVLDATRRVRFVSRRGCELFGVNAHDVTGLPWEQVTSLNDADQHMLASELALPLSERSRMVLNIQGSNQTIRRCEFDLRDDPRDPEGRILHIYDKSEVYDLRNKLEAHYTIHSMIGDSPAMHSMHELIESVAAVDATVLIEGETGTGKELVARAIHDASPRREGPMITINCAGLSDTLINSQLFGHRKGAFTDAVDDQKGVFEAAHNGTIFLDEIGDLPMNTQTRILRALEQREITRIGETEARNVNIRILAATNKNLDKEAKDGRFRLDLLYRVRVARVKVPPLRHRRTDIPLLINAFLREFSSLSGRTVSGVNQDALRLLMDYTWPGNVRELRNAVEFAFIRCKGEAIATGDLPTEIIAIQDGRRSAKTAGLGDERERLLSALRSTEGRRTEAAKLLGISRATFYRRLRACMLDPNEL